MSTKTTFKRVALVAVAALGFGMLSVVPSSAAVVVTPAGAVLTGTVPAGTWITNTTGSATVGTQVASPAGYAQLTASADVTGATSLSLAVTGSTIVASGAARLAWKRTTDAGAVSYGWISGSTVSAGSVTGGSALLGTSITQATRLAAAASFGCDTEAGAGNYEAAGANTGYTYTCGANNGALIIAKAVSANYTAGNVRDAFFQIATTTPGAISAVLSATAVDSVTGISSTSTLQTINISVSGASAAYVKSKTSITSTGNGWVSDEATPVVYAPKAAGASVAVVTVDHLNSLGLAATAGATPAVTFAISGVGTLLRNAASAGYFAVSAGTESSSTVTVVGDGRAGTATITISADGKVVGTETVKFYGNAAKVTAVGFYTTAKINDVMGSLATSAGSGPSDTATSANDPAIAVLVTDALGTPIPPVGALGVISGLTGSSTNPLVVSGAIDDSFVDSGAGLYSAGALYSHIAYATGTGLSGDSSSVTYSVVNASDASIVTSNPIKITLGGDVKTVTMTTDKSAYGVGEAGTVTVTAKDSSGNPSYDGALIFLGVTTTTQFGGSLPSAATSTVAGVATTTFFAPVVPGDFSITGKLYDGSKVTATISVAKDTAAEDAAAEATDAANAATDAANAAAEAADAATAAAQDASDAVAALSAQVATLISGLKAQLTALTNLVIKIQKKVKA